MDPLLASRSEVLLLRVWDVECRIYGVSLLLRLMSYLLARALPGPCTLSPGRRPQMPVLLMMRLVKSCRNG